MLEGPQELPDDATDPSKAKSPVVNNMDPANGFHEMLVHPTLARQLHQFYGPSGHVIPKHFAPMHSRMMGASKQPSPSPQKKAVARYPKKPRRPAPEVGPSSLERTESGVGST